MHLSLRVKLIMIVGAIALSLAIVIALDLRLAQRQSANLEDLEQRLVPKLELEPRLTARFDQMGQALRDAVAAQDRSAIEASDEQVAGIDALIDQAGHALAPDDARALRSSVTKYHRIAVNVSLRLLDGETGEELVTAMNAMQEQHKTTLQLIEEVARLDKRTLRSGFSTLREASADAARSRLSVGLLSLTLVIGLSVWLGRSALTALGRITDGFDRFARGELDEAIVPSSADELGALAHEANRMAAALARLSQQRDASDWIKAGQVELAEKLGGDLDPQRAAEVALTVLAERIEAVMGALYLDMGDGELELSATFAGAGRGDPTRPPPRFRAGEGLVGQAALGGGIRLVEQLPPGYAGVRSGLGDAAPSSLLFVPLRRGSRSIGLVELGLFRSCSEAGREFLSLVCESLAVALDSARSRARLRELLLESQKLAARLSVQEEELLHNNNELTVQQEELRLANDELETQRSTLEARNAELELTRTRLQDKADELTKMSSYKSQFLANMSHELRTPLNSMLLLSQILADNDAGNLTAKQVEHCSTIYSAGRGLLALINQVLDLSKIEAGKQDLHVEQVVLRELVTDLQRTFEPQFTQKGIELSLQIDPDVPAEIATDGQCLQRILINLLGNALKFTERGSVCLRVGRPEPRARLRRSGHELRECVAFAVKDTGVGIPPEVQERIFARFEQADSRTVRRYGGTGLGLSIARESAQLMGGELQVQSVEGEGSTFTCYLPERMAKRDAPALLRKHPSSTWPRSVPDDRDDLQESETVLLIVEDDPVFAERLVETARSVGLKAIVAPNGREALRLARAHVPMGIVMDVRLPDLDGVEVREQLRAEPATARVPVHFVSALEAPSSLPGLNAVGYLEKPASREAIFKVIESLVSAEAAATRDAPLSSDVVLHGKVLIADDDMRTVYSLSALLRNKGADVVVAESGREALRVLEEHGNVGAVLMDIMMPDMDGYEAMRLMRVHERFADLPVVALTARATQGERERCEQAGASEYLSKPVDPSGLLSLLQHWLTREPQRNTLS